MVECIDHIHPELYSPPLAYRQVFLEGHVEVLLIGPPDVEGTRGVAELALDRAHKSRRVDVRLAQITDRTIWVPQRVLQRNARHYVGPNRMRQIGAQSVGV